MSRVALLLAAALCFTAFASAAPTIEIIEEEETIGLTIAYLPTFTVSGVTLDLNGISWTFTNPGFHKDFTTVDKSVTLDEDVSTVTIGHYKSSGTISGLDLSGDGKIQLVLSDKTSHTATYKSTAADTFCPVDDSLVISFTTHTADLTITGMTDDSVQELIVNFVKDNQASLGDTVAQVLNEKLGPTLNKYVIYLLKKICGDLPPPSL